MLNFVIRICICDDGENIWKIIWIVREDKILYSLRKGVEEFWRI